MPDPAQQKIPPGPAACGESARREGLPDRTGGLLPQAGRRCLSRFRLPEPAPPRGGHHDLSAGSCLQRRSGSQARGKEGVPFEARRRVRRLGQPAGDRTGRREGVAQPPDQPPSASPFRPSSSTAPAAPRPPLQAQAGQAEARLRYGSGSETLPALRPRPASLGRTGPNTFPSEAARPLGPERRQLLRRTVADRGAPLRSRRRSPARRRQGPRAQQAPASRLFPDLDGAQNEPGAPSAIWRDGTGL